MCWYGICDRCPRLGDAQFHEGDVCCDCLRRLVPAVSCPALPIRECSKPGATTRVRFQESVDVIVFCIPEENGFRKYRGKRGIRKPMDESGPLHPNRKASVHAAALRAALDLVHYFNYPRPFGIPVVVLPGGVDHVYYPYEDGRMHSIDRANPELADDLAIRAIVASAPPGTHPFYFIYPTSAGPSTMEDPSPAAGALH